MYLEKFKLDGKTAIITGGGQGIGLACAEALAEAGAKVIIADRDGKVADTARASLKAKGYDADTVVMDVTDTKRVSDVANDLVSRLGKVPDLNGDVERRECHVMAVSHRGGWRSARVPPYRGYRACA